MKRPLLLISAAWLIHVASWFLPVVTSIKAGSIDPVPGWAAFLTAARAVWPPASIFDTWYVNVLAIVSVLATIFFVIGSPWVVLRGSASIRRTEGWAAGAAFVINASWYVLLKTDSWGASLGIGYFLWWLSFALVAVGLFYADGRKSDAGSTRREAALLPR